MSWRWLAAIAFAMECAACSSSPRVETATPAPVDASPPSEQPPALKPTHAFVLKPANRALEFRPEAVPVRVPLVDYDALRAGLAKGQRSAEESVPALKDEETRIRLQRELEAAKRELDTTRGHGAGASHQADQKRVDDARARARRQLDTQRAALTNAMKDAVGAERVEIAIALARLLELTAELEKHNRYLHPALVTIMEGLGQATGPKACHLNLYVAQLARSTYPLETPKYLEAAQQHATCRVVALYNRGSLDLQVFGPSMETLETGLEHMRRALAAPAPPEQRGIGPHHPFDVAFAGAAFEFQLGRDVQALRTLDAHMKTHPHWIRLGRDITVDRYTTDLAERVSPRSLGQWPSRAWATVHERLAVRALDRGDSKEALRLAEAVIATDGHPSLHRMAHVVKRRAASEMGRDAMVEEVEAVISRTSSATLKPAERGTAEYDEEWWLREELEERQRLARPVQSLVRLCLEPLMFRAPPKLGVLMMTSSGRIGGDTRVKVENETPDDWHSVLATCLERHGPRVLSAAPVSYRATIDLTDLVGSSEAVIR